MHIQTLRHTVRPVPATFLLVKRLYLEYLNGGQRRGEKPWSVSMGRDAVRGSAPYRRAASSASLWEGKPENESCNMIVQFDYTWITRTLPSTEYNLPNAKIKPVCTVCGNYNDLCTPFSELVVSSHRKRAYSGDCLIQQNQFTPDQCDPKWRNISSKSLCWKTSELS